MQNIESKKFGIYLLGELMNSSNLTPRELMGQWEIESNIKKSIAVEREPYRII